MKKLYYNGNIITMEESRENVTGVVEENGFIIEVGNDKNLLQKYGPGIEKIDLEGNTMLPAFIDSHSHLSGVANSFLQVDLSECISNKEIIDKIKSYIDENHVHKGSWVIGTGYDQNQLEGRKHPTDILKELGENYCVLLQHASSHMGVFSELALEKLNINLKDIKDLKGVIEKKNEVYTGYMEEEIYLYYLKKVPMPNMEDLINSYKKAFQKYASYGITTIQEGMMVKELIPYYERLVDQGMLLLDVVAYMGIEDKEIIERAFKNAIKKYHKGFKINGYKMFLDGSPQGKTAWLSSPYIGEETCGYPILSDDKVFSNIKLAFDNKVQIIAHCNGDAAANQLIVQHKKVLEIGLEEVLPTVMIHAQLLRPDQMQSLCGIIPSFFAEHIYYWGDIHIDNLGYERASKISSANSAKKLNIPFTLHQDSPVLEPNMLHTVWVACNRLTKTGVILGAEEKIDVYDALRAITINGAIQYGEDDKKGTISIGKEANFVILDKNPLVEDKENLNNIQVLQTIKLGKVIYKK